MCTLDDGGYVMTGQRAPSRDSEHKINISLLLVAPLSALSVCLKLIELSQLYKYLKEIFWDQKVIGVKMKPLFAQIIPV